MTEATIKLRETPVKKLFVSYLIPSVLGMLLMSVNIVVDGIFIGRGVGADGLAGVNIAVPAFSIFLSISLWIGFGGATLYSIALGRNEWKQAQEIFSQAITFAFMLISLITVICVWKMEELALLFGANDVIMPYVMDYLSILLTFGLVYVLENILSVFVRNDGNPTLSMSALIVTAILNVLFNYLFIFRFGWGVKGSAEATVLSAGIGFLVLLSHFFKRGSNLKFIPFRFRFTIIRQILTIGFPSFIAEISLAVVTIGFNLAFMRSIGETGVAAYAIVNYIHSVMLLVFLGMGAALQPISSFHFGARLFGRLNQSLRLTVQTALISGLFAVAIGFVGAEFMVSLFDVQSQQLFKLTVNGLGLFFFTYLFLGYNLVYAEYFQSVGQIKKSLMIILCQGMLFVIPLLWILSHWFGLKGIWLALPTAQAITAILVFMMNRRHHPVFQLTVRLQGD
ncbi:MATE family efflux transporter [Desulforamulus aeronauticus]|uniref:Multidrug export protein MepA n=1 Tax=Desulforamulus aeronauticus DSM 10349 TaxID=1121421 RepID=A0A1M6TD25_9FIRM|nr:MATE family efflux transporter [Desulforamulus aeronauticus]SHK54774.1 putative efflux protein, MATE family [Desulforamulus aeronauticus DSM 10349]